MKLRFYLKKSAKTKDELKYIKSKIKEKIKTRRFKIKGKKMLLQRS